MTEKYLYFGINVAGSQTFNNRASQTLQLTTADFKSPLPAGVDFIKNSGLKVLMTAAANGSGTLPADSQQFGSGYGTIVAGQKVDITKACTIHVSSGLITIATKAADPVNGFTINTSTNSLNDGFVVTQLKPYALNVNAGVSGAEPDFVVYPASKLKGIAVASATTTALHFESYTGDANAVDTITLTHGSAKFKEISQALNDIVADPRKQGGVVVVADVLRDIYADRNLAAIESMTWTEDS